MKRTFDISLAILGIISLFLFGFHTISAWTDPTTAPPGGNVSLSSGQWTKVGSNISYNKGAGLGTLNPNGLLHVGTVGASAPTVIYSQNFESGYGTWTNMGGDTCDFIRDQNGTPSSTTGPAYDHTAGTGWYAYIETSVGASNCNVAGNTALMESQTINADLYDDLGLRFWYHLYGSQSGTLAVDVYDTSWHTDVWTASGQQQTLDTAPWKEARVDLSSYTGTIKVRFRFTAAGGYWGDAAIDDVVIENGYPAQMSLDVELKANAGIDVNGDYKQGGVKILQIDTVGKNSYFGMSTGDEGVYAVGVGYGALYNNMATGNYNTGIGSFSLMANNTGDNNTAVGYSSMYTNTSGYANTAQGYRSMYYNLSGYNNTAVGYSALQDNTSGNNNTAVGYVSLQDNTTGTHNTSVGQFSMGGNLTGGWNTSVGVNTLLLAFPVVLSSTAGYPTAVLLYPERL